MQFKVFVVEKFIVPRIAGSFHYLLWYACRTDELEAKLREMGYAVFKLHGKMTVDERKESLANFSQQGGGAVLITTDVMARGVDIPS